MINIPLYGHTIIMELIYSLLLNLRLFLILGTLDTMVDKTYFCTAIIPLLKIIEAKSLSQPVSKF